ncbi:hypothetical protein GCM10027053_50850 [Intrasporangium mesophilum]
MLGIAAILRARYGVDFGDSAHAVELAMRMAQGDLPFRDEMNLQVLGSWPAVPFVWAWVHVVGLDGIVLASRIWYIVFSALCGLVAWRAVSPLFGRGTTAAALGVALIPAAYNQQVVSYNTTPALMYLVAACASTAAVTRRSLAWGVVAGAAVALGALSHPVSAPAAVALLLVVLVQARGRGLVGVLVGAATVAAVVAALALFFWGWSSITNTLSYTELYQSSRTSLSGRLANFVLFYRTALPSGWFYAALVLAVLAAVPPLRRIRAVLLAGAVVATGILALRQGATTPSYTVYGWYSSVLGLVLVVVLLPVTVVCAVRRGSPLMRLVLIGLASYVGVPFIAAFTSGAPAWGASAAVLAPSLFVSVLAALIWVEAGGRVAKAVVAAALVAALGTAHALNSYRDAPLGDLAATVPSGSYAGLVTTESRLDSALQDAAAVERCAAPGDGMLAYLFPSAFLLQDVRFDTPIIWTVAGSSSKPVMRWFDRRGRVPECVVADRESWEKFGRNRGKHQRDPLRDWITANYRPVSQTDDIVVLQRGA